jgi:chaperonin GroEL
MPKPKVVGQPTSSQHFKLGINAIADLLAPTLGPIGGIVANQRDFQRKPELLDDSATAVRRILDMGDKRMDVGAMLMRSMIWRVVQRAGDGGATAAMLARALYNEALRVIAGGANAMQVAKGVQAGTQAAVQALKAMAEPVHNENDLAAVALTVVREPDLAAVLGEMSYLLGPDAHVTIEKYVASYLQQFYHPGASYKAQIASMYLYTDQTLKKAVLSNGAIVLIDGKLESVDHAANLLQAAVQAGVKNLTIVAGHFSDPVIGLMVANSRKDQDKDDKKPLVITGAKPKDVGDVRRAAFDDLALLTGATVFGRAWSKSLADFKEQDLGRTMRSEVTTDWMHVIPEKQFTAEVQEKIAELRNQLDRMTLDDEDREKVVKRLAALSGGSGVLKIGTESKMDREVLAQNAERAFKVLTSAQLTGVVPGAGAALFHCGPAVRALEMDGDARFGVEIVARALEAPLRQILDNARVASSSVLMEKIREAGPRATYDVLSDTVGDAYETGVLDVAGVLSTVMQTSFSSAMMALTTDTIIYHKKPEQALNL